MTSHLADQTVLRQLNAAADMVERDGLYCGDLYPQLNQPRRPSAPHPPWVRGTPGCTITALVAARYEGLDQVPLRYIDAFEWDPAVLTFARHLGMADCTFLGAWSDERTADQVVGELRTCAERVRAGELAVAWCPLTCCAVAA